MPNSDSDGMKCLSIQQPWAWAVCAGLKTIENRSWSTSHRGAIAIHAGSKCQQVDWFIRNTDMSLPRTPFQFSAIIGVVDLVDVVEMQADLESNPFAIGEYCWKFENARLFVDPIPCVGKLRLFSVGADIGREIRSRLSAKANLPKGPASEAWTAILNRLDPGIHQARGYSYLNLGRMDDARRNFTESISRDPDNAAAYYLRALTWTHLKDDPHRCIADCTKSLSLHARHADAHLLRSTAYRFLGKLNDALADERMAEKLEPGSLARWQAENDPDE